jgi:hypothetical protein
MKTIGVCLFIVLMLMTFQTVEGGCGCEAWCRKNGQQYGICGDGHTCICSSNPITDTGRVMIIETFELKKKSSLIQFPDLNKERLRWKPT